MAATDANNPPPHKRCLGCGYILDGLPENRCPECGREFDPDDPRTYCTKIRSGKAHLVIAVIGAVPVVLGCATVLLLDALLGDWWLFELDPPFVVLFMVLALSGLAGFVAELVIVVVSILALGGAFGLIQHRAAFVGALAIALLTIVLLFLLPAR